MYIAPANLSHKIARRRDGRGLDIFLSVHSNERFYQRVAHLLEIPVPEQDAWIVAGLYRALIKRRVTQIAPEGFYTDRTVRLDEHCLYAIATAESGENVCIVFAMKGSEITVITFLNALRNDADRRLERQHSTMRIEKPRQLVRPSHSAQLKGRTN